MLLFQCKIVCAMISDGKEERSEKKMIKGNESLRYQTLNVYCQLHCTHSIIIVNCSLNVPTHKMIIFILFFQYLFLQFSFLRYSKR